MISHWFGVGRCGGAQARALPGALTQLCVVGAPLLSVTVPLCRKHGVGSGQSEEEGRGEGAGGSLCIFFSRPAGKSGCRAGSLDSKHRQQFKFGSCPQVMMRPDLVGFLLPDSWARIGVGASKGALSRPGLRDGPGSTLILVATAATPELVFSAPGVWDLLRRPTRAGH